MAVNQPLKGIKNKGNTTKLYGVIGNFNKGIDKKTADDVATDSSFRELKNFYNSNEGILSKRPAVYNSNLSAFIKAIIDGEYDQKFNIVTNRFEETKSTLIARLEDFYNTVIECTEKSVEYALKTITFKTDKIIGFQILKNNKFLEALQDYETILDGEYSNVVGSSLIEFKCIVVAGGFSKENNSNKTTGLYITRFAIKMEYETNVGYTVNIEIDSVDPTISNATNRRWLYRPADYNDTYIQEVDEYKPLGPIDIANYNGYSYIPTGKDYLIKIDQIVENKEFKQSYPNEATLFEVVGGTENVYTPTPIELMQIGFNILSSNPLTNYKVDETSSVKKIKGVFYTVTLGEAPNEYNQPVSAVPYNDSFNIHVIHTGTVETGDTYKIEYRKNNGETDPELNPYEDLPGAWNNDNTIYVCSGLDSDQSFELKVSFGASGGTPDEFITYISTKSSVLDETGDIHEISNLVLSSTRATVINNQLVLYGGHGYIFFSEYDMFEYFPNYYYIYIASEAGEEAVTGINYFRQYYAIFTNKRIKRMVGAFGTEEFGIYPLNDFVGCSNGNTIRAVGNNLLFLGNDGIYKLKQGYLGEGTENVEKIDMALNNELSLNNVLQAFVMNSNYVIVKNDGKTWMIYNSETEAFYEYNLESLTNQVYNGDSIDTDMEKIAFPFYTIFESNLYDANGNFFIVPMYSFNYNSSYTTATLDKIDLMIFRFSELNFLDEGLRHKDGYGFISTLETHKLNMGYPTNNKKFKEIYIKLINESGHAIPLYISVYVDDKKVIDPDTYEIMYDASTNTYYYVKVSESNKELAISKALGEFTLGVDPLGSKTVQQIKIKVGETGKSIKLILSDGYNDTTALQIGQKGLPVRNRNLYNFSINTIGIVYKVKKVKEG